MTSLPSLLSTEIEDDLRSAIADLLTDRAPIGDILRRTDHPEPFVDGARKLWTGLAEDVGVVALPIAESAGGAGASWRETSVVAEALGRAVADVPFFTSAILATAIAEAADVAELLSSLATGGIAAVVAPLAAPFAAVHGLELNGSRLTGHVGAVAGAAEATQLLVPHQDVLLLVRADDVTITSGPSLDMTRRVADVAFTRSQAVVVAEGEAARAAVRQGAHIGAAMLASEQLGIAEHTLAMTIEYLQTRRQFGRVVGSFQALKHRLADLWTLLVQARAVARYAAACAGAGADDPVSEELPLAASLAQVVCGPTALKIAEECVQLHGGIGFTWEHPAHLYLKRAKLDALALGTAAWHRRQLAEMVDL